MQMDKFTYFWALLTLSMVFFCVGFYKNVIEKFVYVLRLNGLTSLPDLRILIEEVLLQNRIKERSRFLWLRHFLIFAGFVLLFLVDGVLALTTKYFPMEYFATGAGRSILKFALESAGAVLLVGSTLGLIHRLIHAREEIIYVDLKLMFLLWFMVVTGFLTESFRFVLAPDDPHIWVSFIGGTLAGLFRAFPWPWEILYSAMWVLHTTVIAIFFACIPFSKFVHMFVTPIGRSITMADGFVNRKRQTISEGFL